MHIYLNNQENRNRKNKLIIPFTLLFVSFFLSIVFFLLSFLRHNLFQSNYDLILFDQWLWLLSKDLLPISSITGWHVMSDHAAWVLYLFAHLYKLVASVNWLFLSQAICLIFSSLPFWVLSRGSGINEKNSWLVCILWWLQPVVFNVNISDFHPETWAIPVLLSSYIFSRSNRYYLWIISLLFMIGCRDGLILIVFGIFIENILRRKWKYAFSALAISLGWFLFIKVYLFPYYNHFSNGKIGPSESVIKYFSQVLLDPYQILLNINYLTCLEYLILISVAFLPFWKRSSLITLSSTFPLIIVNLLADNPSYRMLIHQYSLPIAAIGVVAVIDSFSSNKSLRISWIYLIWISICWFALAKPYFYTGPYLSRINSINVIKEAKSLISEDAKVLTTTYIAPHLSHRKLIDFPKVNQENNYLEEFDTLLLNPQDPGYGSTALIQESILKEALLLKWDCKNYENGLRFCKKVS